MAKLIFIAALLMSATALIMAAPVDEFEPLVFVDEAEPLDGPEIAEAGEHLRFRRVTCDLLSFGGVVGDTACAGNCLSMGKAGGSCSGGVCQCRKTTFGELWNDRFG